MGGVDSSLAVGWALTGSSSSSVAEWKLSLSWGRTGESSVVEYSLLLLKEVLVGGDCVCV